MPPRPTRVIVGELVVSGIRGSVVRDQVDIASRHQVLLLESVVGNPNEAIASRDLDLVSHLPVLLLRYGRHSVTFWVTTARVHRFCRAIRAKPLSHSTRSSSDEGSLSAASWST